MLNLFKRPSKRPFAPICPDQPLWVVGDIHGCRDALVTLLDQAPGDARIVCVGDYVDRGPDAAGVLSLLMERPDITCLMGNHEVMMLQFLDAPATKGERWLRYGGLQTLASFQIGVASAEAQRDALMAALGDDMIVWLRDRPTHFTSGNVAIVHAGADPTIPVSMQASETLIWGHDRFGKDRREDDIWIVHGHTVVDAPRAEDGIVSIDTGAYATGILTAAHITKEGVTFHSAREGATG